MTISLKQMLQRPDGGGRQWEVGPGLRLSGSYPVAEWRDLRSQLMQIPILAGRGIEERDRPGSLRSQGPP
jgi:hypothetical protein